MGLAMKHLALWITLVAASLLLLPRTVVAQSTFGTIVGTVKDASGAIVAGASVTVTNTAENTARHLTSDKFGNYQAVDVKPGVYTVQVSRAGFAVQTVSAIELGARQTLRIDVTLKPGSEATTVTVTAGEENVTTDTQTVAASLDNRQLLNLPANTRANGNTSPYNLISTIPGVQSDNGSSFSIQGALPSQTQYSVDGISTTDVTGNSPLRDAFPSMESIAEFRVQGIGENAEYGQVADVTTVSKSGTDQFHGDLFWYTQNSALDAKAYGALTKPRRIGNDFGVSAGGPVEIPGLYNGKDKTFFYTTYEGFRYPLQRTIQNEVPTQAMRNGDFSAFSSPVIDPTTGQPFANNQIPGNRISPVAQKILAKLYPLPNAGDVNTLHAANYVTNADNTYNSNQYDIRLDQYIGSKQSMFARYTHKGTDQLQPNDLLVPSSSNLGTYRILVVSHDYSLTPNQQNEFRFGFTLADNGTTNGFDGPGFTNTLGLANIGPTFPFNGLPEIDFNTLTSEGVDRMNSVSHSRTYQVNDNYTWTVGRHTMKFGMDFRHIRAITPLGFLGADNYGNFSFQGNFTGNEFADFLLGYPNNSSYDHVTQDNNGFTNHWAFFAQDTYRISPRLTLNYGLRYEFHPAYQDQSNNIGNFDPSVPRSGRVLYPDGGQNLLAPGFLQTFDACPGPSANGAPCTPVVSASAAGVPNGLRFFPKLRFLPRFGFAYRPFGDDKTAIRGGFGVYNVTVLGSVYYSLTGTLQSDTRQFQNVAPNGSPIFQWPQTSTGGSGIVSGNYGTAYFGTANDVHFKDPYSMQWNLSVDHEIGWNTGVRLTYVGMHTVDLVWAPNLNQSTYSTTPYVDQPLSSRPFPNWGVVNTRSTGATAFYNAFEAEAMHHFHNGLEFDSSYTWAKNLTDDAGPAPGGLPGETGGSRAMNLYNRHSMYGNDYATRRHHWVTSAVWNLPFGKGMHFLNNAGGLEQAAMGGWSLSSIFLWQSGPYLTPYFNGGDPSGTGSGIIGRTQHPDIIGDPTLSNPTAAQWVNPAAFTCPGVSGWKNGTPCLIGTGGNTPNPIGRFGNSGVGVVEGPGTVNLDMAIAKNFQVTEKARIHVEASFTNILNHPNLADPVMNIASPNFGQITSARRSDFGGSRTGQIGVRIEF